MTTTTGSAYAISDLARLADVTPRTIRYYVAQGLLPAPGQSGPGARYPESALGRLRLIRELQRNHLPLAEIRTRLSALSDAEVAALVAAPQPKPSASALEYVRGLLDGSSRQSAPPPPVPPAEYSATSRLPVPPARAAGRASLAPLASLRQAADAALGALNPAPSAPRAEVLGLAEPSVVPTRSQWDRIALTPDVELHIRRPLSRLDSRRVERFISIAHDVLKEDRP
jgi:DNA-binding transcriptional MerR regulator